MRKSLKRFLTRADRMEVGNRAEKRGHKAGVSRKNQPWVPMKRLSSTISRTTSPQKPGKNAGRAESPNIMPRSARTLLILKGLHLGRERILQRRASTAMDRVARGSSHRTHSHTILLPKTQKLRSTSTKTANTSSNRKECAK